MARKIEVVIVGDSRSLERALSRAGRAGRGFESNMQKAGRAAKYAGLAIFGALAVTAKVGFDELAESQKVTAQTEAVLKSTGKAANVTAKQISELATELSRMSGIDDELIQSSENLLLTFRAIRNETGKGNDVFNQATKAALDLSVAFHKDLNSSSILVGKALQDPIRGLTSLRRVGIQFTDSQTAMIRKLVESGNVLDAQKLILAELERQTGGSAKAYGETLPAQIAKARIAFEEAAASLTVTLLPAITLLAQKVAVASGFLQRHTTLAKALAVGLGILTLAMIGFSIATTIATIAAAPLIGVIAAVVLGVSALAIGFALAYRRSETFREAVNNLWALFKITPLGIVVTHLEAVVAAFNAVAAAIRGVITWVRDLINWIRRIPTRIKLSVDLPNLPGGGGYVWRDGKLERRAMGGPVSALRPYLVGERGPELFMPRGAGTIIPNGAGGSPIVVNLILDGRKIASALIDPLRGEAKQFERRTGLPAFGGG